MKKEERPIYFAWRGRWCIEEKKRLTSLSQKGKSKGAPTLSFSHVGRRGKSIK